MEIYKLPTLYGIDGTGRRRMWQVWTEGNIKHSLSGLCDGKKVQSKKIMNGVNIGKQNETTPIVQAQKEAYKCWIKQLTKQYKPDENDVEGTKLFQKYLEEKTVNGGHNINVSATLRGDNKMNLKKRTTNFVNVESVIIPMKTKPWDIKVANKYLDFNEGAYVQWKLDGWRCIARLQQNGEVSLTTNSGKQFPFFSKLRESVKKFLDGKNCLDGLDCELYAHTIIENGVEMDDNARFTTICGICSLRLSEPHPYEDQMCLYVFDLVDKSSTKTQVERFDLLNKLFENNRDKKIVNVETIKINDPSLIPQYDTLFVSKGFEGVIIRAHDLVYKQKNRSSKIRKYKSFIDKEFKVIDVTFHEGVDIEHFVWVCEDPNTKITFKAKPMGTKDQKIVWFNNKDKYIGRLLTVKYQQCSENGVPRFGIAKAFRDPDDMS